MTLREFLNELTINGTILDEDLDRELVIFKNNDYDSHTIADYWTRGKFDNERKEFYGINGDWVHLKNAISLS